MFVMVMMIVIVLMMMVMVIVMVVNVTVVMIVIVDVVIVVMIVRCTERMRFLVWENRPLASIRIGHRDSIAFRTPTSCAHYSISISLTFNSPPAICAMSVLPQVQIPNGLSSVNSASQRRQRARPSISMISNCAPSTTVSFAQMSKQKRNESGSKAVSLPISRVTRVTRAPFACSAQMAITL
jgi:hypothetical protein